MRGLWRYIRHHGFTPTPTGTRGDFLVWGFTLIELLIVIGILSVLAVTVIFALNPVELFRQARDANRLTDMATLHRAITLTRLENVNLGASSTIYVSVPDPAILSPGTRAVCSGVMGLPLLESPWQYLCVGQSDVRKTDGKGWIPIDFQSFAGGSPLAVLPIDPVNTTSSGLYYSYVTGGSYAVTSLLESQKFLKKSALNDGGTDDSRLEMGTDLKLWGQASGLIGYWKFDEGSGITLSDSSGKNNNGALTIGGAGTQTTASQAWTNGIPGKVGGALNFDGTDDYATLPNNVLSTNATLQGWFYLTAGTASVVRDSTFSFGWILAFDSAGTLSFRAGGSQFSTGFTSSLLTSAWHHFAMTKTIVNVVYYLDGQQIFSGSGAASAASNPPWYVMKNGLNAQYMGGRADEIRVYNRFLSAAEIQAYYNATK